MGAIARRGEPEGGDSGGILDVRLSGPPELVDQALEALRLVLEVADASRPYANRRGGGVRVYVRALGVGAEARRFLDRRGGPEGERAARPSGGEERIAPP